VTRAIHTEHTETVTRLTLTRRYTDGLLPAAHNTLTIARQRYASGQGDFMRFLEAFRTWISAHIEYQEHLYAYAAHWSLLEQWVGIDLNQARQAHEQREWMPMEGDHAL
jgi:hypothetical protein